MSQPNPGGNPLPRPTNLGEVWVASVKHPRDIAKDMWIDGPVITAPFGGFTVVPREGATGTVEYAGEDPDRWIVPIVVDGWSAGREMQDVWDDLAALAQNDGTDAPPAVWLSGALPHGLRSRTWVIEKIEPATTDRLIGGRFGEELRRVKATMHLLRARFPSNIASPLKQAQHAVKGAHSSRTIKAMKGDTLVSIAARELGDPLKWRDISRLNGGLQPDNVKTGQRIKLP